MSKKTRRSFSPEFKSGAVEMATRPGARISQAARDLDVGEGSLHEWVKQSQGATTRGLSASPNGPVGETERTELVRLRREVATLRMERDFLKKAAVSCPQCP